jgi:hypothetical protein
MASTYSNLKIQLMATGENSTTWGDVTNVNLGTALEEAIVGSAAVAFSNADVTLTLSNTNASQSARHMRLNLTGTATTGYNLVVPAIQKVYIVNNGTDGTVTVKNTTGTGIAVPAGKTMWVYNNATNVVDTVTHLTSLTLGTPLPLASGGTGGNTAATARTALGATTVGGNVFTLTNPSAITFPRFNADNTVSALNAADFRTAIGAGTSSTTGTVTSVAGTGTVNGLTLTGTVTSSGSLTLGGTLSNVSLATQVTGTLPNANGGTGQTSYTDGQLLIGNTATGGLAKATITAGSGISVTNGSGTITIASTGGVGTVTSVGGTGSVNGLSLSGTVTSSGNLTLGGSVTSVATTATIDGVVIGYRSIPRSTTTTTAVVGDVGKCIAVTAGITIPNSTFAAGDAVSIYNDSGSAITITAGVTTLRQAGTANTGNRTLAARGMATVWFNSATEAIISGAGVS